MPSQSTPSILSADLAITGSITSDGEIQLDGSVEGDIRAGSITIGEKSVVKGEVVADTIIVRGKVLGKLRGRQIQLAATARVEGDITHSSLSMENGAFFEGQCHHASDPTTANKQPPAKTTTSIASKGVPIASNPAPSIGSGTVAPPVLGSKK
ncbi:MAG: polymer-forming cytoskeletal protein [Robiginitomaculum sp.]|nr:polymer-forming cytoskeletal protein [Robiginitomaculum sp.]